MHKKSARAHYLGCLYPSAHRIAEQVSADALLLLGLVYAQDGQDDYRDRIWAISPERTGCFFASHSARSERVETQYLLPPSAEHIDSCCVSFDCLTSPSFEPVVDLITPAVECTKIVPRFQSVGLANPSGALALPFYWRSHIGLRASNAFNLGLGGTGASSALTNDAQSE